VLAVETSASPTPPAERDERLSDYAGPATLVEAESVDAVEVAEALRRAGWLQA
jgi:hypothetical protein